MQTSISTLPSLSTLFDLQRFQENALSLQFNLIMQVPHIFALIFILMGIITPNKLYSQENRADSLKRKILLRYENFENKIDSLTKEEKINTVFCFGQYRDFGKILPMQVRLFYPKDQKTTYDYYKYPSYKFSVEIRDENVLYVVEGLGFVHPRITFSDLISLSKTPPPIQIAYLQLRSMRHEDRNWKKDYQCIYYCLSGPWKILKIGQPDEMAIGIIEAFNIEEELQNCRFDLSIFNIKLDYLSTSKNGQIVTPIVYRDYSGYPEDSLSLSDSIVFRKVVDPLFMDQVNDTFRIIDEGELLVLGAYQHGLRSGEWILFHPNGKVNYVGKYKDGLRVGKWKFWDPNGKLYCIGHFRKGIPTGIWKYKETAKGKRWYRPHLSLLPSCVSQKYLFRDHNKIGIYEAPNVKPGFTARRYMK